MTAALESFGTRGYSATSLDQIATGLGVRKQTILYWFPNKEALLDAVVDRAAGEFMGALQSALDGAGPGWQRVEAVVRAVFRMSVDRPELLGLVRELGRLGTPTAVRFVEGIGPLLERATTFLDAEMSAGRMRKYDARFFLVSTYSVVIGVASEIDALRALGMEVTPRALVRRRNDVLRFLENALVA